jgi:hypothetical protein
MSRPEDDAARAVASLFLGGGSRKRARAKPHRCACGRSTRHVRCPECTRLRAAGKTDYVAGDHIIKDAPGGKRVIYRVLAPPFTSRGKLRLTREDGPPGNERTTWWRRGGPLPPHYALDAHRHGILAAEPGGLLDTRRF